MTWSLFWLLIAAAGIFLLGFLPGHKLGRFSCRFNYPKGWDQGKAAERERWEQATGTTWDALAAWNAARPPDIAAEWEAWDHHGEAPSTEVLLTAANERLGKPPKVPSVAEVDELAAEYEAMIASQRAKGYTFKRAEPGPPIVADLTGPDAWHYPGEDDVPTITGLIVTGPRRTGPEWLDAQLAAQDSETAAWMRRVEAECVSYRRGITTGART